MGNIGHGLLADWDRQRQDGDVLLQKTLFRRDLGTYVDR